MPGAASCGRVAPLIARQTATAFSALDSDGHERARRDEVHEPGEERLVAWTVVVPLGERPVHLHELEPHDAQAALLVALEDAADEQALDAVGLDEDQGSFAHVTSLRTGPAGQRLVG